jgi:branched-chain amino acid transport system ATP-binding protein
MDVVFEIRKRGVTVLLVEQDVVLALNLCDRGYVFEEGTVFIEGTNEDLKKNPRVREAYLGCN